MRKTKPVRKTKIVDGQVCSVRGVPLTRASNTMTEAAFVSWVLSYLRNITKRWKPKFDRLNMGRKKLPLGKNGRDVWANTCEYCGEWFRTDDLEMDHLTPVGGLLSFDEIPRWLNNALVEIDGYRRACIPCHKQKTKEERIK